MLKSLDVLIGLVVVLLALSMTVTMITGRTISRSFRRLSGLHIWA